MAYMETPVGIPSSSLTREQTQSQPDSTEALLVVLDDSDKLADSLEQVCDYLGVAVKRLPSESNLLVTLRELRPMGVVAQLDCQGQDGFHVMRTVAEFDRCLPVMLITGQDAVLAGAIDAVEEITGLETLVRTPEGPDIGGIVDFVFRAGQKAGCVRLLPV